MAAVGRTLSRPKFEVLVLRAREDQDLLAGKRHEQGGVRVSGKR
jgi:hypothetical protein